MRALLALALAVSLPLSALAEEAAPPVPEAPPAVAAAPAPTPPAPPAAIDPNAAICMTFGEMQKLTQAALAEARWQDAAAAAQSANAKLRKQIGLDK